MCLSHLLGLREGSLLRPHRARIAHHMLLGKPRPTCCGFNPTAIIPKIASDQSQVSVSVCVSLLDVGLPTAIRGVRTVDTARVRRTRTDLHHQTGLWWLNAWTEAIKVLLVGLGGLNMLEQTTARLIVTVVYLPTFDIQE